MTMRLGAFADQSGDPWGLKSEHMCGACSSAQTPGGTLHRLRPEPGAPHPPGRLGGREAPSNGRKGGSGGGVCRWLMSAVVIPPLPMRRLWRGIEGMLPELERRPFTPTNGMGGGGGRPDFKMGFPREA